MILTKENIKSINLDDIVDQKIKSGKLNELLVIVPTNRKLRHFKKDIISAVPGKTADTINIETLGTIATRLLEQSQRFIQLSEAAATVLIKQSASDIKLNYFSIYKGEIPFGTLDRVKNVITEYKKQGITPNVLRKEAEKLERNERLKAEDIAAIYEIYQKKCKELNALEIGDIYNELNKTGSEVKRNSFDKLFPNVNLIVANGFNEFTSPEVEILNSLSSIANVKTYINFDYYLYNKSIFAHLDKCYDKLETKGFKKADDTSVSDTSEFTNAVRQNLFNETRAKKENKFADKVIKISAEDREEEIDLIAKEVKSIITKEKVEPHRVCIAFNLIQDYSPKVRDKFVTYGIPINLTDRLSLDNSLPVSAIINFLEILDSDFYYKNIFRALSSGFINIGKIDLSNLMKVASSLKIVVGYENWKNVISDAIMNLKYSDDSPEEYEFKKRRYEKALTDIKTLYKHLHPFTSKFTISEFLANLEKFTYDTKLFFKLLEDSNGREEEYIKGVSTFFETITEVFNLLSKQYGDNAKFPLKFYLEQIRTACGWARFNVKEKSDYGVLITTVEEIRGLNFSHLFLAGLCDGDFPTRYSPEIFFSGSYQKKEMIHQTEERYRFYQALCSWSKKLYLVHPLGQAGRELVESIFLKDFASVFEVTQFNKSIHQNVIFSREDLLKHVGQNSSDKTAENVSAEADINFEMISNAISVDKFRMSNPTAQSPYAGYLGVEQDNETAANDSSVVEKINERMPSQFSISQLESYALCPFKYFIERIMRLETFEEPVEEIEALEMGSLLHAILFKFYIELRNKKIELTDADKNQLKEAEEILFQIAEEEVEGAAFLSPLSFYEKEKILGLAGNKKDSILYKLFESEIENNDDYIPEYFEVGFGKIRKRETDDKINSTEPLEIDNIKLRGKIDRIEINRDENKINIVDYKLSGKKPTLDELWEGLSLQLPLYLYAARKLLKADLGTEFNYNKMFIYSLKYLTGKFGKNEVRISMSKKDGYKDIDLLIDKTLEHIISYVKSIKEGKFNLSQLENREEKVCKYCDYKAVCRVKEMG